MTVDVRTGADAPAFLRPISVAFGNEPSDPEAAERWATLLDRDRMHCAYDDGALVGSAAAYTYELTVPGGAVPAAGVAAVGVLPTHRRRGILTRLMREQLEDVRRRGEAVAILWATEERIYGRFGYGLASLQLSATIDTRRVSFRNDARSDVQVRLLDAEAAYDVIPAIYDEARRATPGMVSRSESWWRNRRLFDSGQRRDGYGALFRALVEVDGRPEAYTLYRLNADLSEFTSEVDVREAIGTTVAGTREVWRYLVSLDLAHTIHAGRLSLDHPLVLMVEEPRRLKLKAADALWLRIVDLPGALGARSYGAGDEVVLDVADGFCPWNEGRWRVRDGRAERVDGEPDLRLDVSTLGSVYLGGFTFAELARAGQIEETRPGGVRRADALFRTDRAPWCPETF